MARLRLTERADKDIDKLARFPMACKDGRGRLRVGAAVGVFDYERAESLIQAGVDVLVVDSAHGHSSNVLKTVAELKRQFQIDIIAGLMEARAVGEEIRPQLRAIDSRRGLDGEDTIGGNTLPVRHGRLRNADTASKLAYAADRAYRFIKTRLAH